MKKETLIALIVGVTATLIGTVIVVLMGVVATKPTITLAVDSPKVVSGGKVRVSWDVKDADIVEFIGTNPQPEHVARTDQKTVVITQETTFRIVASIRWLRSLNLPWLGTEVSSKTVTILSPPSISFWSEPSNVLSGEEATLRWQTSDADRILIFGIESGPIPVDASGSHSVNLNKTKTFKIEAKNRAGIVSKSVTVIARIPDVSVHISAEPSDVELGAYAKITWNSRNASKVTITGLGGVESKTVEPNGSVEIPLNETTRFEITATDGNTTSRDTAIVTVHQRRLVFLGTQNASENLDQGIRPEVENSFSSKGYNLIEFTGEGPTSFEQYRNSSRRADADYAVVCKATVSGWQGANTLISSPWASVKNSRMDVTLTISLVRMRDGNQLATKTGKGSVTATQIRTSYGDFSKTSEAKTKEIEAAQKATRAALAQLPL